MRLGLLKSYCGKNDIDKPFPRNSTASNHINKLLATEKYSDLNQDKSVEWQTKNPDARFFLRKLTTKVDLVPHNKDADPSDSQEDCGYNFLYARTSE